MRPRPLEVGSHVWHAATKRKGLLTGITRSLAGDVARVAWDGGGEARVPLADLARLLYAPAPPRPRPPGGDAA